MAQRCAGAGLGGTLAAWPGGLAPGGQARHSRCHHWPHRIVAAAGARLWHRRQCGDPRRVAGDGGELGVDHALWPAVEPARHLHSYGLRGALCPKPGGGAAYDRASEGARHAGDGHSGAVDRPGGGQARHRPGLSLPLASVARLLPPLHPGVGPGCGASGGRCVVDRARAAQLLVPLPGVLAGTHRRVAPRLPRPADLQRQLVERGGQRAFLAGSRSDWHPGFLPLGRQERRKLRGLPRWGSESQVAGAVTGRAPADAGALHRARLSCPARCSGRTLGVAGAHQDTGDLRRSRTGAGLRGDLRGLFARALVRRFLHLALLRESG